MTSSYVIQFYRMAPGDLAIDDHQLEAASVSDAKATATRMLEEYFFDPRRRDRSMPHHAAVSVANDGVVARMRMIPGGRVEEV